MKLFKLLSALMAFVLWGGWAYFVNLSKSAEPPILFAIVQGVFSFVMTLVIVKVLEFLKPLCKESFLPNMSPVLITTTFTSSLLVCIHYVIQTPNIVGTVLAPLTVAFLFCLVTIQKINKKEKDGRK